jgi:hypothetical protein
MTPQLHMTGSVSTAAISAPCASSTRRKRGRIVPGQDDELVFHALRLPSAHQYGLGRLVGPGFVQAGFGADEDIVEPTVILPLELHELGPAGIASRQADRRVNRFRARNREANELRARDDSLEALRQFDLAPVLAGDGLAGAERGRDRPDHRRCRVPQDRRAIAQHEVDKDVAVDVVQTRPLAPLEEQRRRLAIAHIAVHASGHAPHGLLVESRGFLERQHHFTLARPYALNSMPYSGLAIHRFGRT